MRAPLISYWILRESKKLIFQKYLFLILLNSILVFINDYNEIHLEVAADYLVMAAWLTYLKSRLLLPKEEKINEYTSDELEEALRYQLQRLEFIQNYAKKSI